MRYLPKEAIWPLRRENKIELWDFSRRKFLRTVELAGGGAVAFSLTETHLAAAGHLNRQTVFDVASGEQLGQIHAMMGVLVAAEYSPDGGKLAVCSEAAEIIEGFVPSCDGWMDR